MKKFVLLAIVLTIGIIPTSATRKIPAPTREEMVGAWFGYNDYDEFLRLNLKADGTGTLVWLELGSEGRSIYDIPKWEWSRENWKLDFTVKGRTANDEEISIRVKRVGYHEIDLSLSGKHLNWKREANLRKESEVLRRLKAATIE
jgi:hypothetical protein